jgi:dTDP-4-dehydrorhamnose reductase
MKILITGASGLLGNKILKELAETIDKEIIAVYNKTMPEIKKKNKIKQIKIDLSNTILLQDLILKEKPETIIHTASYTDVDGCEINKEYAWKINVEATKTIAKISKALNIYLIYISTDYVFEGTKGLYRETDTPNPINYYGLTKLIGEETIRAQDNLHTIIRTSAIYGLGQGKQNFGTYIISKLSRNEKIKALKDQYVSPTLNTLLAKAVIQLLEIKYPGTLHIAGERMSRFEFARAVARELGFDEGLVEEAYFDDFTWRAPRPRDSSLNVERARRLLAIDFYSTSNALRILREEYSSGYSS